MTADRFIEITGISPITLWRWRKRGWIKTVNIAGRNYIPQEEVDRFNQRAGAGEFASVTSNNNKTAQKTRARKLNVI